MLYWDNSDTEIESSLDSTDPPLQKRGDYRANSVTEVLGEVTLLYFEVPDGEPTIIGKLPGIHSDRRGKTVKMTVEPEKVHLFHNGVSLLYR